MILKINPRFGRPIHGCVSVNVWNKRRHCDNSWNSLDCCETLKFRYIKLKKGMRWKSYLFLTEILLITRNSPSPELFSNFSMHVNIDEKDTNKWLRKERIKVYVSSSPSAISYIFHCYQCTRLCTTELSHAYILEVDDDVTESLLWSPQSNGSATRHHTNL